MREEHRDHGGSSTWEPDAGPGGGDGGIITITGSGKGVDLQLAANSVMSTENDAMRFVFRQIPTKDGVELVARLRSMTGGRTNAQAGVMIRAQGSNLTDPYATRAAGLVSLYALDACNPIAGVVPRSASLPTTSSGFTAERTRGHASSGTAGL